MSATRLDVHLRADELVDAYLRCFSAHVSKDEAEYFAAYEALDHARKAVYDTAFNAANQERKPSP